MQYTHNINKTILEKTQLIKCASIHTIKPRLLHSCCVEFPCEGWLQFFYYFTWFAFPSNSCMNTCECASFHLNHWTAHHNLLFSSFFFFSFFFFFFFDNWHGYTMYTDNSFKLMNISILIFTTSTTARQETVYGTDHFIHTQNFFLFFLNQCVLRAFLKGESKRCIYICGLEYSSVKSSLDTRKYTCLKNWCLPWGQHGAFCYWIWDSEKVHNRINT